MNGEVLLIIIVSVVILGFLFMFINNIKYSKKQANIEKEKKKKDTQPVADISPKQIDIEKDLNAGTPLNVNDPIFTKKQYENITDRTSLQALIEEEKQKDNLEIVSKLRNIEITDVPVEDEYNDMVTKSTDAEKEPVVSEPVMEMVKKSEEPVMEIVNDKEDAIENLSIEQAAESSTTNSAKTIEIIKQLANRDKQ